MGFRSLTPEEEAEVKALNKAVDDAIAARREWMDRKMLECSDIQVGDDLYDLGTGKKVGVVTEITRFWRDRDMGVRDRSCSGSYHFRSIELGIIDNTSRYICPNFGSLSDMKLHNKITGKNKRSK